MPFTLAHPAAVLPLARRPLVLAALVAGSMAPDVPYFLRRLPIPVTAQSWWEPFLNATTSHDLAGVLLVDLPLGLLLWFGYLVARRPLASMAPLLRRGEPTRRTRWLPVWIVVSLVVGTATHLLWDALTVTRLLQHLSTALGLAVVTVHLWRHRNCELPRRRLVAVLGVVAAVVVVGCVVGSRPWWEPAPEGFTTGDVLASALSEAATTTGVLAAVVLVVLVVGWWVREALRPSRRVDG